MGVGQGANMRRAVSVIYLSLLCLAGPSLAIDPSWFNGATTFKGIATYYGEGSHSGGHCVLRNPYPAYYANMRPLAMNNPQYDGSVTCGMCLRVWGHGVGIGTKPVIGPFMAYVADECPECHHGDLDLAADGDGRWEIEWEPLPCPDGPISFYFEGSNPYYLKVQPRGMKTPATRVTVGGQAGVRTPDNFFEIRNGGGFQFPVPVTVETVLGCVYETQLEGYGNSGFGEEKPAGLMNYVCNGVSTPGQQSPPPFQESPPPFQESPPPFQQSPPPFQQSPPPSQQNPPPSETGVQGDCAPLWQQCGGINFYGPTCCSEGQCVKSNDWYSQCLQAAPVFVQQQFQPEVAAPVFVQEQFQPEVYPTEPIDEVPQSPAWTVTQGACSGMWEQCGGNGWNGPTCCSEGSCVESNEWYSQCL